MDLLKRQDAIKDLKTEQKMREKVWRKASSKPVRFLDMEHQRRKPTGLLPIHHVSP